jgi:glycosyltransferase involved in cell wall biosynthesis
LKIALVTHFFPAHGGGVELVAQQIARRLAANHACEIAWCASDTDPPPDLPGIQARPMRTWNAVERLTGMPYPLWSLGALRRLAQVIRDADAVHVHDCVYQGSLVGATLARWYDKRLVVTQHIGHVPIRNPLLRFALAAANRIGGSLVLRRAQAVVFISLVVKTYFEGLIGTRPTFAFGPNGVDTDLFNPGTLNQTRYRERLGFDPARPLLLFVGRFVPKKRLPVVRALAAATPDWQWCLVGEGPDDPHAWGLPNVAVRGPLAQSELPDYYRAADLLVLPSEGEGFPLVVQEAMACGLPVCCSSEVSEAGRLPAEMYTQIDPRGGVTAVAEDAAAIRKALNYPSEQCQSARSACREFSRAWSWDTAVIQHATRLESNLDDPHSLRSS